jgi:hypothetical protein
MNAFGDFAILDTVNDNLFDFSLVVLATFIVCAIMMNLLIGILSEKLAEIVEKRAEKKNEYAEKCMLVF